MKKIKIPWTVHILTLFPEMFPGPLEFSIIGKKFLGVPDNVKERMKNYLPKFEINKQIAAGQEFMEDLRYNKAKEIYENILGMEAILSKLFEEEKKKVQNLIMGYYYDLVEGKNNLEHDENIIKTNKDIHRILGEISTVSGGEININVIKDIVSLYKEIPLDLFEHKSKISRKLYELFRPEDKKRNT